MTDRSGAAEPVEDAAEAVKARLRADLRLAMRARAVLETAVLRATIAVLDNAQAVPPPVSGGRYVQFAFGDPSAEVPRLNLSADAVRELLEQEVGSRREAADQFDQLGRTERGAALRAEADIVARYL